jgi:hypothetical protein
VNVSSPKTVQLPIIAKYVLANLHPITYEWLERPYHLNHIQSLSPNSCLILGTQCIHERLGDCPNPLASLVTLQPNFLLAVLKTEFGLNVPGEVNDHFVASLCDAGQCMGMYP